MKHEKERDLGRSTNIKTYERGARTKKIKGQIKKNYFKKIKISIIFIKIINKKTEKNIFLQGRGSYQPPASTTA